MSPELLRFREFHRNYPQVAEKFYGIADYYRAQGRDKYSARAIFQELRWWVRTNSQIETPEGVFKISNFHSPYLARMYLRDRPAAAALKFFTLRPMAQEPNVSDLPPGP